jgi:hypothetical protein
MRARSAFPILAALTAVGIGRPAPAAAQAFEFSPTYQASVATAFTERPQSRYQAWGAMVGLQQTGVWSPHVWVQRYRLETDCQAFLPAERDCRTEGWTVSVGPALRFIDDDRWTGLVMTQVGLDSRSRHDFTGGAGIHVGVKLGAFEPHAFSRLEVFRGRGYTMVGVGLRFRISDGPTIGDPEWGR